MSSGSRAGSTVFKPKRGGISTTNTCWDGPPPIANHNPNQQHNGGGNNYPQNSTQMNKGNGHALPLPTQPWSSRPISNLLATRKTQDCWLLYKTPLTIASCQCQVQIPVKGQTISRSMMSETGTRTDPTQISNKQTSSKGVFDLPNTYKFNPFCDVLDSLFSI